MMVNNISVSWITINVNHKFENITDALKDSIWELIRKWFEQKLDRYIKKHMDPENLQAHLNVTVEKTDKGYNWNFNFKLSSINIIYKRENFKNINDLINHFFEHAKEELSKK